MLRIGLAVFLASLIWPSSLSLAAQESAKLPAYYPKEFTFVGCIQRIGVKEVVISDTLCRFAPDVTFNTTKTKKASRAWFRPGRKVGVIINSDNKIESLWYLGRCK